MRQIDEPIGAMLSFIGHVANSDTHLRFEARRLLQTLEAERYLTPCATCGAFPTEAVGSQSLCRTCQLSRVHLLGHPNVTGTLLEEGTHNATVQWDSGRVQSGRRKLLCRLTLEHQPY